ncbi:Yip1 family protein [Bacillus gaemokensis]|uniref:Membrane protein n=1 Tax=Bacillus gaemokensis TaxID=574375 RepID=A0A073KSV2_9BACI|nr:Yip1 family protein [Bacillus gaemokensis]KEK25433.1 membrane protein [Bacillus gaemokensis]KYG37123.1 hypothetical protein AZF08_06860 [Bacillus gaemokensis]
MEANVNTQKVGGEKPSLLGMITSPGVQFERMKSSNAVWGAFWLMAILTGVAFMLATYAYSLTPEGIKEAAKTDIEVPLSWTLGMGFVLGFIGAIIGYFVGAAVYKVLMMLMGNDTSYKKLLAITVYVSIITVLGLIVNYILALVLGGTGKEMYTGLGPVFASTGGLAHGIASNIEVFTIWGFVLSWLGLQIAADLSKKKATILIIIFAILTIGFGALRGMF